MNQTIQTAVIVALFILAAVHGLCYLHQPLAQVKITEVYRTDANKVQLVGDLSIELSMFSVAALHAIQYGERMRIIQSVSRNGSVLETDFIDVEGHNVWLDQTDFNDEYQTN